MWIIYNQSCKHSKSKLLCFKCWHTVAASIKDNGSDNCWSLSFSSQLHFISRLHKGELTLGVERLVIYFFNSTEKAVLAVTDLVVDIYTHLAHKKWKRLDLHLKEIFCVSRFISLNLQLASFFVFFLQYIFVWKCKTDVTENKNLSLHPNVLKRSLVLTYM